MCYGFGVPVVIGPLCGGMDYPPGFRFMESKFRRSTLKIGRGLSNTFNRLFPGKLRASALVVANEQTRRALPAGCRGRLYQGIPDIGVALDTWARPDGPALARGDGGIRFVYLGRLVDWKGVDLLIEAFAKVAGEFPSATLEILGDGVDRKQLEALVERLGIGRQVAFAGWVKAADGAARMRAADVFVLPSLRECGGSAAFEAMASGLPVIVANWGGPGIYVDDSCGFRVEPTSREGFVSGLADAMIRLARDPELRHRMGEAAIRHASGGIFNWDRKIDKFLEIYRETVATPSS